MPTKTETVRFVDYRTTVNLAGAAAVSGSFTGPLPSTPLTDTNSFTGADNRSWKSQVRAGANATTAANGRKASRNSSLPMQGYVFGYVQSTTPTPNNARRVSLCVHTPDLSGPASGSAEEVSCVNAARSKFSSKAYNALTQFQGGVFLAELRETLHMIRRPGQSLWKEIGSYLGTVRKNARSLKRQPVSKREQWLSNTWLEYSFGWKPLLNDLDDARNYLQRRQDALYQELVRIEAVATSRALRFDQVLTFTSGVCGLHCRERRVDEYTSILSGAVSSRASGQDLISASAMGLAPRNFVPTLWEVIPWSFVVDYFSNIGDVINAWSNQTVRLAWGRETLVRERRSDLYDQRMTTGSLVRVDTAIFIPSYQVSSVRTFNRNPITTPPIPTVAFELPGFGTKWINLGALANTRRALGAFRLWV